MSPFVTVKPRLPNGPPSEVKISGILASEEQAKRALGEEQDKVPVYEWTGKKPPAFGEFLTIEDGQIQPITRPWAFDFIESAMRREEISHLYQMLESLQQYVSSLETKLAKKLANPEQIQGPQPTDRRICDFNVLEDRAHASKKAVADYVLFEQPALDKQIIMTPSTQIASQLNRDAQQQRIADGSFDRTEGFAHNNILLHKGDRIQFMKADEELGVTEFDLGEVVSTFFEWRSVAIALDRRDGGDGRGFVLVNLQDYPNLDLGYATTFERGRQMDIRHAFVLGEQQTPTRQFVDQLTCFRTMVYADQLLAAEQFSDWMHSPQLSDEIDLEADPLGLHISDH